MIALLEGIVRVWNGAGKLDKRRGMQAERLDLDFSPVRVESN